MNDRETALRLLDEQISRIDWRRPLREEIARLLFDDEWALDPGPDYDKAWREDKCVYFDLADKILALSRIAEALRFAEGSPGFASVDGSPKGGNREDGCHAKHDSAVGATSAETPK